jgi:hypothetical protein
MTAALMLVTLALGAAAEWHDAADNVRCLVPPGFDEADAARGRYLGTDGLTHLEFVPFTERSLVATGRAFAQALLTSAGATGIQAEGTEGKGAVATGKFGEFGDVVAAAAVAESEAGYAGVVLVGPASNADGKAVAQRIAATCQFLVAAPAPAASPESADRVFDPSRRVSFGIPADSEVVTVKGATSIRGPGWKIFIYAPRRGTAKQVEAVAEQFVNTNGAASSKAARTMANGLNAAIASGTFLKDGQESFVESIAIAIPSGIADLLLIAEMRAHDPGHQALIFAASAVRVEKP